LSLYVYIYVDKERGENIRWRLTELDRDKYKDDEDGDTVGSWKRKLIDADS
jgi:hypothetical protein